jgi:hypothetical protein
MNQLVSTLCHRLIIIVSQVSEPHLLSVSEPGCTKLLAASVDCGFSGGEFCPSAQLLTHVAYRLNSCIEEYPQFECHSSDIASAMARPL